MDGTFSFYAQESVDDGWIARECLLDDRPIYFSLSFLKDILRGGRWGFFERL